MDKQPLDPKQSDGGDPSRCCPSCGLMFCQCASSVCQRCGGMGVIDTYPGGCECCVEPEEIKCPVCDGEGFTSITATEQK